MSYCRAFVVFAAIFLQSVLVYSCSVVQSSFYVTHLVNRGIPKLQVGLIGMVPGVGFICSTFFDGTGYFLHTRKMSLRIAQCMFMAIVIVNCVVMGLVELLPTDYNQLLAAILIIQRTLHGFLAFLTSKLTLECCRAWFPDHFNLTNGLQCSGMYFGGSLAILMGGYVYEAYGYQMPYVFTGIICLLFWLYNLICMPKNSDPVIVKVKEVGDTIEAPWSKEESLTEAANLGNAPEMSEDVASSLSLSWRVAIPVAAMILTVVLEGFTAAITTPYLKDIYDIPISRGSSYVFVQYIGLMVGAASSGSMLQLGWFSASKVTAGGSILCVLGVMLVFPGEGIYFLYKEVPNIAYIGIFLQGYGSQMIGVATLPALEETHVVLGGRPYTSKNKSTAASIWLSSWMMSVYGGHLVALMVMELMSFSNGGWMLAVFSSVSVFMSIAQDIAIWRAKAALKRAEVKVSVIKVNKLSREGVKNLSVQDMDC